MSEIRVAIAGYGKLGAALSRRLQEEKKLSLVGIVEPDSSRRERIPSELAAFPTLPSLIEAGSPQIIIDCSARGAGGHNLEIYQQFGIPAVLQSGEGAAAADLYKAGRVRSKWVRFPTFSAEFVSRTVGIVCGGKLPTRIEGRVYRLFPQTPSNGFGEQDCGLLCSEVAELTGVGDVALSKRYVPLGNPNTLGAENSALYVGRLFLSLSSSHGKGGARYVEGRPREGSLDFWQGDLRISLIPVNETSICAEVACRAPKASLGKLIEAAREVFKYSSATE